MASAAHFTAARAAVVAEDLNTALAEFRLGMADARTEGGFAAVPPSFLALVAEAAGAGSPNPGLASRFDR